MIRHIRGTIADISEGQLVIDVAGVGYLIHTVTTTDHFKLDTEVKFHTYMAIQERAQDLYGFLTRDALALFTILLTIPKVGPKSAMQIMQKADTELLRSSVLSNDAAHLSKMSGIGKKTAEKIVLELKDKLENFSGSYTNTSGDNVQQPTYTADAIDALISLGYPQSDARQAIQQLPDEIQTAHEAVREALKELGKA